MDSKTIYSVRPASHYTDIRHTDTKARIVKRLMRARIEWPARLPDMCFEEGARADKFGSGTIYCKHKEIFRIKSTSAMHLAPRRLQLPQRGLLGCIKRLHLIPLYT